MDDPDIIDDRPASSQTADAASQQQTTPTQTATPDSSAAASSAASSATQTSTTATPTAQAAAGQSTAGSQTQAQAYANMREYAASLGVQQASGYNDDQSFVQALVNLGVQQSRQLQEAQRMAQYGQLWLNNQAQQQPQSAPAAPQDPFAAYKAPTFDPRWEQMIQRDPATGEYKLAPGADPAILPKYHAYREHRDRIGGEFLADPVKFLTPIINQLVGQQGKEIVDQRVQQMQVERRVDEIIGRNADWAFAKDGRGQRVYDMYGNAMLTQHGERYKQLVSAMPRMGVVDPTYQDFLARSIMAGEAQAPNQANAAAQQVGNQQRQAVLNNMNRQPNAGGSMVGQDNTGHQAPAVQNEGLSLRDQLAQAMKAEGITDDMLAADTR